MTDGEQKMLLFKEILTLRALLLRKEIFTEEEWKDGLAQADVFLNDIK